MKRILFHIILLLPIVQTASAQKTEHCIEVVGRPSADSIMLRWAPTSYASWLNGNKLGYTIERYTLVRKDKVISPPEAKTITEIPIRPLPLDSWERIVNNDKYAAIAAQALYGSSFEIDMGNTDVFQIVNKAKENDQRYQFALFSADMSVIAAKASGLLFTDKDIKPDEKYLYRISIYTKQDTCQGSIFISSKDVYKLPSVSKLKAERKGHAVMLQWQKDRLNMYTAYAVERSENGKAFVRISDDPITNFSPDESESSQLIYSSDSVSAQASRLWYRVVGVTPFGEYGPIGESVEVTSADILEDAPYINTGYSEDNKAIVVGWEFPEKLTKDLKGFHVDRAASPNGDYKRLTPQLLPAATRQHTDIQPAQVNYYRVSAISKQGKEIKSPLYLVQLVDSIPPAIPLGLKASVNEFGQVTLSWNSNTEPDIYGYRVYKANYKGEELSQVTQEPIPSAKYDDMVNLNTLNKAVYYQVMAIDKNQNHSGLSSLLEVKLPDKVKPVSPVFLPVKVTDKGVQLSWQPSSSDDVVKYDVYRQPKGENQWMRVVSLPVSKDSVYSFTDNNLLASSYLYTVLAIDDSGLESEAAQPVAASKIEFTLRAPVIVNEPIVNRERKEIKVSWAYQQTNVKSFMLYRSVGKESMVLYRTLQGTDLQFIDKSVVAGEQYSYRIVAVFDNQVKSEMSKIKIVSY